MTMLDLTNHVAADTFLSTKRQNASADQTGAIKQAMSAYRRMLRNDLPTAAWGTTLRIAKATPVGAQELTGCGCGCS
jgi:hypothetical protein